MAGSISSAARDRRVRMLAEVREGLLGDPKELPSTYFYDARGSRLFEEITRLPEYYLTRCERALLQQYVPAWVEGLGIRSLVELGAGSAEKTRIVLDALTRAAPRPRYVPVDVSAAFLEATAAELRREYPTLEVTPVVADIGGEFAVPATLERPCMLAFLGSTIGNFTAPDAVALLRRVRRLMEANDCFLLGVDLRKDVARIEAAYNDRRGVTAAFNKNILRVLNRELGADFDPDAFRHRAFYNRDAHRIEMHLVSTRTQRVTIPGVGTVSFLEGESIRTEVSHKYDRKSVDALFGEAALALDRWTAGPQGDFALALGVAEA